jgi:hypothetical protein
MRPPAGPPPPVPRGLKMPGDTQIVLDGANFTLDNLLLQLQAKSQQQPGNPANKYAMAAQQIKNANSVGDINDILTRANIMTTRNGLIKGGRRTRKLSKKGGKKSKKVQKGGYTYKSNKRRSITSARPSSKTSSKR